MKVFIGYDAREDIAYRVAEFSLRRHSSIPLDIEPISSAHPLYKRTWHYTGAQKIDNIDSRPFSTDFAFARFLVPAAMKYEGWALFVDSDVLFRADIAELLQYNSLDYALYCIHHNFWPRSPIKMDGMAQQAYFRKCWSSFALWNCQHPANAWLTPDVVNRVTGSELHTFSWLREGLIGELPEEWNWLCGHSSRTIKPKAIHYTEGGPWMTYRQNVPYKEEWLAEKALMEAEQSKSIEPIRSQANA